MHEPYESDREDLAVGERFAAADDPDLEPIVLADRESTEEEVNQAIEQEQIIKASRSVRAGTEMLFSALRKNGIF